jgi:hypothetical protein
LAIVSAAEIWSVAEETPASCLTAGSVWTATRYNRLLPIDSPGRMWFTQQVLDHCDGPPRPPDSGILAALRSAPVPEALIISEGSGWSTEVTKLVVGMFSRGGSTLTR